MKRLLNPWVLLPLLLVGCMSVEVKPIHITVDVNVRVEKALDDFFGDLDKKSTTLSTEKKPETK